MILMGLFGFHSVLLFLIDLGLGQTSKLAGLLIRPYLLYY